MKTFVKGLDIDDVEQRATEAAALVDAARAAQKAYAGAPEINDDTEFTALHEATEACVAPLATLAAAVALLTTDIRTSGPMVRVVAEVLLGMLRSMVAPNLVSFTIEHGPDDLALVTVQRPTGKTPIELMRAANDERDALKLESERLNHEANKYAHERDGAAEERDALRLEAERLRTALAIADVERIGIHRMLDEARIARTEPETTLRGRVQAVLDVLKTAEAQAKR